MKRIEAIQGYLTVELRYKLYLLLTFVSLILLFYSIWQINPVVVELDAPLGLASYLTPSYWAGLALLVLISIFAFLDGELKKDAVFITILIVLGLFLFGVPVFAYENARIPDVYYPPAEVYNLLVSHHTNIETPLLSYYSWPSMHFISASILTIAGIGLGFIKYVPLLYMLLLVLITYGIGKRLELAPNRCFLLSFVALSSWMLMFHYNPNALGMLLYLFLLMLLLAPQRRTVAGVVIVMLIFGALVMTHGLTSIVVIAGLIILSIYRKEPRFIALFIVVFAAWMMYQAPYAMEAGVKQWFTPFYNISELTHAERYQIVVPTARLVARYSQLSYVALYALCLMASFILLAIGRTTGQKRKQVISLFCWSIGVGSILIFGYGEVVARSYVFVIVPVVCITILSLSSRKLLIALMILCAAIFLPANYTVEAPWNQVTTVELRGAQFFAQEVKPQIQDRYFYNYDFTLFCYYDPNMVWLPFFQPGNLIISNQPAREADIHQLDNVRYVVLSKKGSGSTVYTWGEDPFAIWPQTEVGKKADIIYSNGYFQIYRNNFGD